MSRAWILVLAAVTACGAPTARVAVDLATVRVGFVDDRPQRLDEAGEPTVGREAPGPVDVTLRLPDEPELQYHTPPGVGPLQAEAQVGGRFVPLDARRDAGGMWRASLPEAGNEPATIRLRGPDARGPLALGPRIVGRTQAVPPVLAEHLRPGHARPNVVLYVVDTLRTDRMSLYGYHRPTTPHLERLARKALVFENAYAAGSFTSPSVTSLFASRFPSELRGRLEPDGVAARTMAEVFRSAGYDTAAFQANLLCAPRLGYARGFDRYERLGRLEPGGRTQLADAAEVQSAALAWVREREPGRPFFLYLQSMDVHFPYDAPAPFRDLFMPPESAERAAAVRERVHTKLGKEKGEVFLQNLANISPDRYDGGVAYADHAIAAFLENLEALGLADRTIVVVTSDHGEPLFDRGELFHGRSLYEELVHVPLLVWLPGLAEGDGARIPRIVSLLDVAPTLADLAGIPVPTQFLGRSLLAPGTALEPPAALGELVRARDHAVQGWFVREGPWKLIADARDGAITYRLFHLPTDPGETRDVAGEHPQLARYLLVRATSRPTAGTTAPSVPLEAGLSDAARREREEALRALGYVE